MGKNISTETVKKLFGIQDWKEFASTKKIKQFLSSYSFLDHNITEEIIKNIPKFNITFNAIISELKEQKKMKMEKDLELTTILNNLKVILSKEELSFEERKLVIEQMNYVTNEISQLKLKREERKKKIVKGATMAGAALAVFASQLVIRKPRK